MIGYIRTYMYELGMRMHTHSPQGQVHVYVYTEACGITYIRQLGFYLEWCTYVHLKVKMVPSRTEHRSLAYLQ